MRYTSTPYFSQILFRITLVSLAFSGCARPDSNADQGPGLSAISMLFAPNGLLEGSPNLYEISISRPEVEASVTKRGDLPTEAGALTIDNLPSSTSATVRAALYRDLFVSRAKTHTCSSNEPVALIAGETASLAMTCYGIADASTPVQVFIKIASLSLTISETTAATILDQREWTSPSQFAQYDA